MSDRQIFLDIGIFAHNEAATIQKMISDLLKQDILYDDGVSVRVLVLANGCSDATAQIAREAFAGHEAIVSEVVDLKAGGKSRTWNHFVHELSRPETDYLCFLDADIELPDSQTLSHVLDLLRARPTLVASSSQAIKDLAYNQGPLSPAQALMVSASGGLSDWKKAIIGSLYIARAAAVRGFYLPIGLPVEDGFVRAMLLTESFSEPEDLDRLDGDERAFHIYEAERTISGLLRHQTRLVIGSAINATLFAQIQETPQAERKAMLQRSSEDPDWLPEVLRERLPSIRFGWVPLRFLTKRVVRFTHRTSRPSPRDLAILLAGCGFDLIVYVLAQFRMARGDGAGHW